MKNKSYSGVNVFGWEKNPFTLKILPNLFIGYENEMDSIRTGIDGNSKVTLLLGPTGSGKTTMLKHLIMDGLFGSEDYIYLPKPPKNPEDFIGIFINFTKKGIFNKLFSRKKNVNLYDLSEHVNDKIKEKKLILVIDEAHESTTDTMEWLRTISDQIGNMTLLLAGLPVLENKMISELETFYRRVDTVVKLTNLNQMETRELIKKRIEWAGGNDLKPFTARMVDHIYEKTGGFPREVLRACNEHVSSAVKKKITMIDIDSVPNDSHFKEEKVIKKIEDDKSSEKEEKTIFEAVEELPQKQRDIVDILSLSSKGLTPTEIVLKMDTKSYKNKDNAIRSVNNILRRMSDEGSVTRQRKGKAYKYLLSEKLRTAIVSA